MVRTIDSNKNFMHFSEFYVLFFNFRIALKKSTFIMKTTKGFSPLLPITSEISVPEKPQEKIAIISFACKQCTPNFYSRNFCPIFTQIVVPFKIYQLYKIIRGLIVQESQHNIRENSWKLSRSQFLFLLKYFCEKPKNLLGNLWNAAKRKKKCWPSHPKFVGKMFRCVAFNRREIIKLVVRLLR